MKFERLEIKNIASIKDATIDFGTAPLDNAGVYLITGETGAGKSILLDSICLALYGTTPRVKDVSYGGIDPGEKDKNGKPANVQVTDARQFLRRGTGEGWTTLDFEGTDGSSYTATWYVARAHKVPGRTLQAAKRMLVNRTTGHTLIKVREIDEQIKLATGLEFKQFCRTTLLAQGEFTKFLKSDDNDKADILEKVTGVDIYRRLGARIHQLTSDHKQAWERANDACGAVEVMDDVQRAAQASLISALGALTTAQTATRNRVQAHNAWLERKQQLVNELLAANRDCEAARRAMKSEDMRSMADTAAAWRTNLKAIEAFRSLHKADADIGRGEAALQGYARQAGTVAAAIAFCRAQLEQFAVRQVALEKDLAPYMEKQQILNQKSLAVNLLDRYGRYVTVLAKTAADISDVGQSLEQRKNACAVARESLATAQETFDKNAGEIATVRSQIQGLDLDRVRDTACAIEKTIGDLKRLEEINDELKDLKPRIEVYNKQISRQRKVLEGLRLTREHAAQTAHEWASQARAALSDGDLCPVCNRRVLTAELPHEDALRRTLQLAREQEKEAANALDDSLAESMRLETRVKGLEKEKTKVKNGLPPQIDPRLDIRLEECRSAIGKGKALDKNLDGLIEKSVHLKKNLAKCQREFDALDKAQSDDDAKLKALTQLNAKVVTDIDHCKESLAGLGIPGDDWAGDAAGYARALEKDYRAYSKLLEESEKITVGRTRTESHVKELDDCMSLLGELRPDNDNVGAVDLVRALKTASSLPVSVAGVRALLTKARNERLESIEVLANFDPREVERLSAYTLDEISGYERLISEARHKAKQAAARVEELSHSLNLHLPSGLMEGETVTDTAVYDAEISELNKRMGVAQAVLDQDTRRGAELDALRKVRDDAYGRYVRWSRLDALLGSADGGRFKRIALSYVLSSLARSANRYLATLTDRYTICVTPGSFVISVEDAYQDHSRRPASTISGGESFLVSLAFALALSDLGQGVSSDTLFIDEGFGTLSGEPLMAAIDTLRALHGRSGRHVGIISHIDELRERIPVQIRVQRDTGRSSSTVTVTDTGG